MSWFKPREELNLKSQPKKPDPPFKYSLKNTIRNYLSLQLEARIFKE